MVCAANLSFWGRGLARPCGSTDAYNYATYAHVQVCRYRFVRLHKCLCIYIYICIMSPSSHDSHVPTSSVLFSIKCDDNTTCIQFVFASYIKLEAYMKATSQFELLLPALLFSVVP